MLCNRLIRRYLPHKARPMTSDPQGHASSWAFLNNASHTRGALPRLKQLNEGRSFSDDIGECRAIKYRQKGVARLG